MAYQVQLEVFQGPFDLLLHLISRRQVEVTEIDLADITADFLRTLHAGIEELDLESATRFLMVAATLIELKAARLLPAEQRQEVEDLLGEDRSRVVGLIRTLEGALGQGAAVTADDITTFGGDQGSTVPWALDDAIDKGDVAAALALLPRLIPYAGSPSDRNGAAFRLLAVLHKRYSNMLRLDGADVRDDKSAAALLGMKGSTFPAKKAMQQSRRLGTEKLGRAIDLLADADLSLRGTKDWPPELVVEVLVARLANLSGRR